MPSGIFQNISDVFAKNICFYTNAIRSNQTINQLGIRTFGFAKRQNFSYTLVFGFLNQKVKMLIVTVKNCNAAFFKALENLGLGFGDSFYSIFKITDMNRGNGRDNGNMRFYGLG